MDATTIERLKHAQEVLGWMADGKDMQWLIEDNWKDCESNVHASLRVGYIMNGAKYRLKPAKTIRPFTEQEARRLVGCVAFTSTNPTHPFVIANLVGVSTRHDMMVNKWHYHLPGDHDNPKPCWVEE